MEKELLKKLNFRDGHKLVCVLEAPASFAGVLEAWKQEASVDDAVRPGKSYDFALIFAIRQQDILRLFDGIREHLVPDAALWFAYPKKSARRFQSDISRDQGWEPLGDAGFEGVRMVAIDGDWSALRFRHATFIRSMKRDASRAMSSQGKHRTKKED